MLGLGIFITTSALWLVITKTIYRPIKRLNIIFDLDNTLIMSLDKTKYVRMNNSHKPDIDLSTRVVWLRPWVHQVLWIMNKFCNIYLFTKAEKYYADTILSGFGIEHYFKSCKYKQDCGIDNKDIRCFSSSYDKLIEFYAKIKFLKSLIEDDDSLTENPKIIKSHKKIIKSVNLHTLKMSKFVSRTVLVDDQITNNILDQHFYHINYYQFGMIWDIEMIKLLLWVLSKSVFGL